MFGEDRFEESENFSKYYNSIGNNHINTDKTGTLPIRLALYPLALKTLTLGAQVE